MVLRKTSQAVEGDDFIQRAFEDNRYLHGVPATTNGPGSEGLDCPRPSDLSNNLEAIVEDQNRLRCIL